MQNSILVTGGAGFIGSNFVLDWFEQPDAGPLVNGAGPLVNLDKLTYAGNPANLAPLAGREGYTFVHGDILDTALLTRLFQEHRPRAVVHFAAESHVDRSITTRRSPGKKKTSSASSMFLPTKSTARCRPLTPPSARTRPTLPTAPTRPRKLRAIILSAPGTIPSACPP
jgi:hypothetical protein